MNERQPFCWWMTFSKVSNLPLPPPPVWLTMRLLWGRGLWVRIFSLKSLELEIFPPTYNSVRFIFQHYIRHERFFVSVQDIIFPSYILASFFPSKSVCRIFFLKSPISPSKVIRLAPKIHQTFAQLTDSDLSIISKAF